VKGELCMGEKNPPLSNENSVVGLYR